MWYIKCGSKVEVKPAAYSEVASVLLQQRQSRRSKVAAGEKLIQYSCSSKQPQQQDFAAMAAGLQRFVSSKIAAIKYQL